MSLGAAGEVVRRSTGQSGQGQGSSIFMSEANIRRLVDKLSKMRGAALKLGQFMSIQGRLFLVHYCVLRVIAVYLLSGWGQIRMFCRNSWRGFYNKFKRMRITCLIGSLKYVLFPAHPSSHLFQISTAHRSLCCSDRKSCVRN
jgi:hypothetical protein